MSSVQLQFHADAGEVLAFGFAAARSYGLRVVLEQYFPDYRAVEIAVGEAEAGMPELLANNRRVTLCRVTPDLTATTTHEFVGRNPGSLFLSLERTLEGGLRESMIAGSGDDPETLRVWRSVIRQVKSAMHRGAVVRNPMSGAEDRLPKHLHTQGAHALAAQGVPMLAGGGWAEYVFDDVSEPLPTGPDLKRLDRVRGTPRL